MKKLFFFAMTAAVLMGCKSNEPGEGERVIDMLPKTRFIELTQSQKDFVNKNTFLDSARITSWPSMNSARN